MKYNFYTGENAKKVKYSGYKYLGKGKLGKLKREVVDKKIFYFLVDYFNDWTRICPKTFDKSKFKKAEESDWKYKGGIFPKKDYIEKQKPKRELIFKTKIQKPKERFLTPTEIKLGNDNICFFDVDKSNVIRDLQLKEGDKVIVKFAKEDKEVMGND